MHRRAEAALIRRAKAGDGQAVQALVEAHQDSLYAFMLRLSGRPEVAEDIVQESFVRVLRHLDRFDQRFRFSTWLFTIARRLYVNSVQKRQPRFDSTLVASREAEEGGPGGAAARDEALGRARRLIEIALEALNEHQREIVLLFHQQSWSIVAIAEHLSMPEGTVKSHLHRARKRMKVAITAHRAHEARARGAEVPA